MATVVTKVKPTPKKPYTPVKAKAVTIALAFPYSEGVLVCADTQMSYPTGTKYSDHKITAGKIEGCPCIFAFADQVGLASEMRTKIFRQIERFIKETQASPATDDLHAIVEATMNEYGRLQIDLPLELALAIYPRSEPPAIIHFDGKAVTVKTNEPVILGCGNDSLTRFLTDNLFNPAFEWEHALAFGCYVVKKAAQYVQGCGEPIEGVSLTKSGVKEVDDRNIEWGYSITEWQELEMQKWLFKRI